MKNNTFRNTLLALLAIIIFSCSDGSEDPAPAPHAAITQDKRVMEVNETVNFTNASTNADRYKWDFGNGQTSTSKNPSVTYSKTGTYIISLISYNSEGTADSSSSVIKVGERYLTAVKIYQLNFSNPAAGNWDQNDGPDLRFNVGRLANAPSWDYKYIMTDNFNQSMLPKFYSLNTPILLTDESWNFQLEDFDNPGPNEIIGAWQVNPRTSGQKNYDNGIGSFMLTGTQMEIVIAFDIR
jgi:hypothetical protein